MALHELIVSSTKTLSMPRLPADILSHIFRLSHRETLFICSDDPLLFPFVERHYYHHVIVHIGNSNRQSAFYYSFEPDRLSKLVSENPQIVNYVRILQIHFEIKYYSLESLEDQGVMDVLKLEAFTKTLATFPLLECVMITHSEGYDWCWPGPLRAALEDRLNLPSVREIHMVGGDHLPASILDNCEKVKYLTLGGIFSVDGEPCCTSAHQLQSLTFVFMPQISVSLISWLKLRINALQSLKCVLSHRKGNWELSGLLGACSETLKKLDIDLKVSRFYTKHKFCNGQTIVEPLPQLSAHFPNLQQLTVRTAVDLHYEYPNRCEDPTACVSRLPAAAEIINTLMSSTIRHLVLSINFDLSTFYDFRKIDFSPLAILGPASRSIPRIDLYVSTGIFPSAFTRAHLLAFLEDYEDIMKAIKDGVLVVHSEKTAPEL